MEITVIAQDPDTRVCPDHYNPDPRSDGHTPTAILTSKVRVPVEILQPGPRSHRFYVVDYDMTTGASEKPVTLTLPEDNTLFVDEFANFGDDDWELSHNADLLGSARFRAQNVYAIAARTLSLFEFALGRRVSWSFESHQLHLVPSARMEANAYYDRDLQAVLFGYCAKGSKKTFTGLSHDVVAHEVTHAILDGLRPRYLQPGPPDQAAFHEAFADLVALLSVFEMPKVLRETLLKSGLENAGKWRREGRLPEHAVTSEFLERSVLWSIAEQLGRTAFKRGAVRYSEPLVPLADWRANDEYTAPHQRCQIVVGAVMATLRDLWAERVKPLVRDGAVDLDRTAEEGATIANYLLCMLIRGLDYLPPVDLEFEDVIDAVIAADEVVSPDDPHDFRGALQRNFDAFGIKRPRTIFVDYTKDDTPWPSYTNISFASLRSDRDEVFRFIWQNAGLLGIDLGYRLYVSRVRTATRVGPDGLAVDEVVTDYTQSITVDASQLGLIVASHPGDRYEPGNKATTTGHVTPKTLESFSQRPELQGSVMLLGGGTLVFDEFARLRFHQRKALAWSNADIVRQAERLEHLIRYRAAFDEPNAFRMLHSNDLFEELW